MKRIKPYTDGGDNNIIIKNVPNHQVGRYQNWHLMEIRKSRKFLKKNNYLLLYC